MSIYVCICLYVCVYMNKNYKNVQQDNNFIAIVASGEEEGQWDENQSLKETLTLLVMFISFIKKID